MKKTIKEKNIQVFNADVKKRGSYVYTDVNIYSAHIASLKQSEEIISMAKDALSSKKNCTILDVGSGDGTYTFELMQELKPKKIVGFDVANEAVSIANKKVKKSQKGKIKFFQTSIYEADKNIKQKFDVVIVRGVLHHLYQPEKGIDVISKLSDKIVVVEPNGYNPILKVIEKMSAYHREHEEKSYRPSTLNKWFQKNGFRIKKQYYFGIVPFFCPPIVAKTLKATEPIMENIPYLNRVYCASNAIIYER